MVVIERLAEGRDRRTKIVATIGPATSAEEALRALLQAGMNVARLNFSHGTPEEHLETIQRLRRLAAELEIPVAILQDLPGPKVRIGTFADGTAELRAGASFTLTARAIQGSPGRCPCPTPTCRRRSRPGTGSSWPTARSSSGSGRSEVARSGARWSRAVDSPRARG
jgi:pyruvate kinase